ncbi:MAG TPA: hypothetical protein PK771_04665, partial [Spirochaetota bacterium]|nr:hypothetical protein [Spirochaetota bacterium]
MKRSLKFLPIIFIILAFLFSCESGGGKKSDKPLYEKGNIYGNTYGYQMTTAKLIDILVSIDFTGITRAIFESTWPTDRYDFKFKQFAGESAGEGYTALYTGVLKEGGEKYTWGYKKVYINSIKALCVNVGWKKPVYVSVEAKTIPLTAVPDGEGLKVGIGEKTDDFIYVGIDTIEDADIWYVGGMANQIRNDGFMLGAASAVVGECCVAQAESNMLLLRDIARLTKAVEITSEDMKASDYDAMLKGLTEDKLAMLNDSLKQKAKIQKQLTDAIGGAVVAVVKKGMDFALQITNDALNMAAWTLNGEVGKIASYFVNLYGTSEEAQRVGKL